MSVSFKTLFIVLVLILVINTIVTNICLQSEFILEQQFMVLSIWKAFLILGSIVVLKKYNLGKVLEYKKNFWPVLLSCLIVVCFSFYTINSALVLDEQEASMSLQIWYLFSAISTGGFEEILFRIFVFNSFFTLFFKRENGYRYMRSIVFTSLLFGGVHIVNLLKSNYDLFSVINQMIIAFGIGILFQSLLIRYKNVLIVITLHGLFNYFGMYRFYLYTNTMEIVDDSFSNYVSSMVLTILFAATISAFGLLLIRKNISKKKIQMIE